MNISDYINIGTSIILSLGGSSFLVIALSSWLGKVWANRILEQDKHKYQTELGKLKNSYDKELELYKNQLEKSKEILLRYSESQFQLYNDLWISLCDLKFTGILLWEDANLENLTAFARQLLNTYINVERKRLLIEEDHYKQLLDILDTFSDYQIGKDKLIKLANIKDKDLRNIAQKEINQVIQNNQQSRDAYTKLLEKLVKSFKEQILK